MRFENLSIYMVFVVILHIILLIIITSPISKASDSVIAKYGNRCQLSCENFDYSSSNIGEYLNFNNNWKEYGCFCGTGLFKKETFRIVYQKTNPEDPKQFRDFVYHKENGLCYYRNTPYSEQEC